jgi:ABC-type lipoprotein export system ATPase subunit/uncharacterized membrane protein (DUF2068 family)/DNA-dependent RNA polymerase auxiliary subunit epsilon
LIKLEHVKKVFKDGTSSKPALDDVTISFDDTGLVVIMGPSGCGKTTLLNIIGLLDQPSEGTYRLNTENTNRFDQTEREYHRRTTFAFLFQHYYLLDGFTAYENAWLAQAMAHDATEATDTLHRLFTNFGLAAIMNQPSQELSGGEAQRTALIRALAKDTPIIVADEPTGALDRVNGEFLMKVLKAEAKRRLVIVVTHDQTLAERHADRLIKMDQGKIKSDFLVSAAADKLKVGSRRKPDFRKSLSLISRRFYRLARPRLGFAFTSLVIGTITGLLTFGLHHGGPLMASSHPLQNPDYNVFYLRKRETVPIQNTPMNLVRYERPSLSDLRLTGIDLSKAYIDVSLRGILAGPTSLTLEGRDLPTMEFRPLVGVEHLFPADDRFTNVYLNQAAHEQIEDIIGNICEYDLEFVTNLATTFLYEQPVADAFACQKALHVLGVVDSGAPLPTPIVYYSHLGARRWLESLEVANLSTQMGYPVSWYQRVAMGSGGEAITNQELLVVFPDQDAVLDNYRKMGLHDDFAWESSYGQDYQYLISIVTAIDYGLMFFVTIGAIASALTLGLSMSRVYLDQRKRLAILWEIGYSIKNLKHVILTLGRRLVLTALSVSFALTAALAWGVNRLIENRYGLNQIIRIPWAEYQGIALLVPVAVSLVTMLIMEATIRLMMSSLNTKMLIKELTDDD